VSEAIVGSSRFQVLRQVGRGGMGVVYEAFDRQTNAVVALKVLSGFSGETLYRFKREFRAVADIQHPNLLRLGELYFADDRWFFTMELVHGQDFLAYVRPAEIGAPVNDSDLPTQQLTPTEPSAEPMVTGASRARNGRSFDEVRLRSALRQLASAVAALHYAGRAHRDIKPSNVLVRDDGHVVLLDFGLIEDIGGPREKMVVGTPYFMAPEQITNESVGPETDWYAFGVLLFLSLTGKLPFSGSPDSVIEAKRSSPAPDPSDLCSDVPSDLEMLCRALLARDPAARPSRQEILHSLGASAVEPGSAASPPFSFDSPSVFIGRRAELDELKDAFARTKAGEKQLLLVQGEPGVGKSTLVRHFLERAVPDAVVLSGRCYEQESVPFKAFDTVIDSLSLHLANLSEAATEKLLTSGVRFLSSVFPVLRRVPAVAARSSDDREVAGAARVREQAFRELKRLLGAIAEAVPLVLFVDDLQWADQDSLALVQSLLTGADAPRVLFIATLRTTTLDGMPTSAMGPLIGTLPFRHLHVHGLSRDESRSLWQALWTSVPGAEAPGLADPGQLLDEATGHPLFLAELVRHARSETGSFGGRARLQDVLWQRIAALDSSSRRFMEMVALAGAPIRYDVVAQAAQLDVNDSLQLLGALRTAQMVRVTRRADERLVEPYHDRIREAIVEHVERDGGDGSVRPEQLHLRLGRRLLESTTEPNLPAAIFAIVKHLNAAGELVDTRGERRRLAELNLLAGRQAMRATAYATSLPYLRRGISLLGSDAWQADYTLSRALHMAAMEAGLLADEREQALHHFAELRDRVRSDDRTELYVTRIVLETGLRRLPDAIAAAQEGLAPLGVVLPATPHKMMILGEYLRVRWAERRRPPEQIAELPELNDPRMRSVLELLDASTAAAAFSGRNLVALCTLIATRISLQHGVSAHSALSLASYGSFLATTIGNAARGNAFGEGALRLEERFASQRPGAHALFINGMYVTPWARPLAEAKDQLQRARAVALERGDITYEAYSAGALSVTSYCAGDPLAETQAIAESACTTAMQRRDGDMYAMSAAVARYSAALRGQIANLGRRAGDNSSDEAFAQMVDEAHTPVGILYHNFFSAQLAYLEGDSLRANALLERAEQAQLKRGSISPHLVELRLQRVLQDARGYREAPLRERLLRRQRMRRHLAQLANWAHMHVQNYGAHRLLASAEHARIFDAGNATKLFADAIRAAREQRHHRLESLALELTARHLVAQNERQEAAAHRDAAVAAYARWGADARAHALAASTL
jgi:serine/threonine protein kinase